MTTIKPRMRREALIELQSALSKAFNFDFPFQSCLSCVSFRESDELCLLVNLRPPAKVIVYGCDQYMDNREVPF